MRHLAFCNTVLVLADPILDRWQTMPQTRRQAANAAASRSYLASLHPAMETMDMPEEVDAHRVLGLPGTTLTLQGHDGNGAPTTLLQRLPLQSARQATRVRSMYQEGLQRLEALFAHDAFVNHTHGSQSMALGVWRNVNEDTDDVEYSWTEACMAGGDVEEDADAVLEWLRGFFKLTVQTHGETRGRGSATIAADLRQRLDKVLTLSTGADELYNSNKFVIWADIEGGHDDDRLPTTGNDRGDDGEASLRTLSRTIELEQSSTRQFNSP